MNNNKIVAIPNTKTVLVTFDPFLNIGDKLEIYATGPKIIDPETKDILGTYDIIKDLIEVTAKYDRFYECQKIKMIDSGFMPISPLHELTQKKISAEMNLDHKDIDKELDNKRERLLKEPIKVGDLVRKK